MASAQDHEPMAEQIPSQKPHADLEANQANTEKYEEEETPSSSSGRSINGGDAEAHKDETDGGPAEKVASKASVNNVAAIPNGGLTAWLQVLGAFLMFFNSWGIVNTFGVYQTFYEQGTLFKTTSSNLSWIGALQACLLLLIGALAGPIYDAGYFRWLISIGSVATVFGQMMLSLCTEYYQVFLAQAVCIGLGCGLLFVPSVAIISTYFTTKIAFAVGIAASGSSFGGVIYPVMFHKLLPQVGFAWTTRIIGFVVLGTLIIPNMVMKVRVLPAQRRALFDISAWKEAPYVLYVIGSTIGFAGLYVPFFYIQYYAITTGITDPQLGFYLLAILNSASIFGRIIPNFLADKTGPLNMIIPCALATSILIFACIGIHNVASIIVFSLLYGFFSGTFVSLPPTVFVQLSPTRGIIGTRMGMGFSVISIGVLVGTPIAGTILGYSQNPADLNFVGIWAYGGALTAVGAILMLLSRCSKAGLTLMKKV